MVSETLKEWVKQKRKKGVSDKRIKKSLEKTGHDPSVVDELENPFEKDSSTNKDSTEADVPEDNDTDSGDSSDPVEFSDELEDYEEKDSEEESNNSGSLIPDFNFSNPLRNVSGKKLGVVSVLLLVLIGGAAVYSFMPSNLNSSNILGSSSTDLAELESLDTEHSGCPDSGVRVQTVSSSEGVTTANVIVSRNKANVVLEVKQNGETIGYSTDNIKGEARMTVDAVGDEVNFRPLGCTEKHSTESY